MGIVKKYLPELKDLKEELVKRPDNLKKYGKAEIWVGPSESVQYLEKLLEKEKKKEK